MAGRCLAMVIMMVINERGFSGADALFAGRDIAGNSRETIVSMWMAVMYGTSGKMSRVVMNAADGGHLKMPPGLYSVRPREKGKHVSAADAGTTFVTHGLLLRLAGTGETDPVSGAGTGRAIPPGSIDRAGVEAVLGCRLQWHSGGTNCDGGAEQCCGVVDDFHV